MSEGEYPIVRAEGIVNDYHVRFFVYCPKCESDWIIEAGTKNGDKRFQCKACKRKFYITPYIRQLFNMATLTNPTLSNEQKAKLLKVTPTTIANRIEKIESDMRNGKKYADDRWVVEFLGKADKVGT